VENHGQRVSLNWRRQGSECAGLTPLTFNSSNAFRAIPGRGLAVRRRVHAAYGPIFAGSVVAILPVVVIVLTFKRTVISGLTAGPIK